MGLEQINLEYGKVPPSATEIEEALLGALMIAPRAIEDVLQILKKGIFYKSEHNKIFDVIMDLKDKNNPIDMLSVTEELRSREQIEDIGGPFYIVQLTGKVNSAANVVYHSQILMQKFAQREIIRIAGEMQTSAFDDSAEISTLIDFTTKSMVDITKIFMGGTGLTHISEIGKEAEENFKTRIQKALDGELIGIPTGLKMLDEMTTGWLGNNLVILAGRPSHGKTALLLHFIKVAAESGVPVCAYELEMSGSKLYDRMLVGITQVDSYKYNSGKDIDQGFMDKLDEGRNTLNKLPLWIDDKPDISMNYICNHSRIKHEKGECGMVVIDYLQLALPEEGDGKVSREREVAIMSRKAKALSKELDISVILLAQLSRKAEDKSRRVPTLGTLRESGAIEQDADIVIFAHRPSVYGDDTMEEEGHPISTKNRGQLIIAKNREGPLGVIPFYHSDNMTIIKDAHPPESMDMDINAIIESERDVSYGKIEPEEDLPF